MKIRQLSVFLENKVGRLDKLTKILGDNNINIGAIAVADTESFGIVRLIVDKIELAEDVLKQNNFVCKNNNVTVVAVSKEPGGLAKVLSTLHDAAVNIEYMYAIAQTRSPEPLMVFRFDNGQAAIDALEKANISILNEEQLF